MDLYDWCGRTRGDPPYGASNTEIHVLVLLCFGPLRILGSRVRSLLEILDLILCSLDDNLYQRSSLLTNSQTVTSRGKRLSLTLRARRC